jgi:membrane peptidoglycan carboxypeptidase
MAVVTERGTNRLRPARCNGAPAPPPLPKRGDRRRRRWVKRVAAVSLMVVVVAIGGLGVVWVATPSVADAPARVAALLAAHGATGNHGAIPTKVAEAVIATEDSRFYADPALDPAGTIRAGWGLVTANPDEGGATLEVQLAKLLYTPGRRGLLATLEQVGLAFKLDAHFTKTQILGMYLDAAYFGDGAYGITAAAEHYFGLTPSGLSWAQASLLAGLVQAPSAYDPHHHLAAALARRDHVLDRLVATGVLSRTQAEQADEPRSTRLLPSVPTSW